MNRQVNAIAGRMSLRAPQREALELLDRLTEIIDFKKAGDAALALRIIQGEFPTIQDFEREFPSLCFALATGVGKTRLMGAFITYLHQVHGHRNFFVMAPNLTIYNKLIADFTPNTRKYVFQGISDFAINPPLVVMGDNYEHPQSVNDIFGGVRINVFNISKLNSEVRGGKNPRIKRLHEVLGQSYFEYLANQPDLVLLMDESHRYRASAGVKAINDLKPVLGLELTATPFVESSKGPVPFKNVIQDYPLARAMADGFVKEPAVVTRENFSTVGMQPDEIERIKLEDGIRVHEATKVELETYARSTDNRIVKPFVLVIARDTTHAAELLKRIESPDFFEGRYLGRVIQVDSSKTGAEEDEMIQRLLAVESPEEKTEIVIHVNMLKEGWDVTNLYTIVPLRAANARTLIEQSIGRGLRLPYGKRTGVKPVDQLNIIAHDRFQEIVDEANSGKSIIRMEKVILTDEDLHRKTETVVSTSTLETLVTGTSVSTPSGWIGSDSVPLFKTENERKAASLVLDVAQGFSTRPDLAPNVAALSSPAMRERITLAVQERYAPAQTEMEGIIEKPDIAAIVEKTLEAMKNQTIDMPRIVVLPRGEVKAGYHEFRLNLTSVHYPNPSNTLVLQTLRTGERSTLTADASGVEEVRLQDYLVRELVDYDDISYEDQADLLYDLSTQVVEHLRSYLANETEVKNVLICHAAQIGQLVHSQMREHAWEKATEYETKVTCGFMALKKSAYTVAKGDALDFRAPPVDKSNMSKYLFGGFKKSLYPYAKFDSDAERRLAVILDREALKWLRPVADQFHIRYGLDSRNYQPDFVAETDEAIYMLEPKAKNELDDVVVLEKAKAAKLYCQQASAYNAAHGGKPWKYLLIPHDAIMDNMTIKGLEGMYG
ncbi:MAG: DEAD/DEAH box helicase family protein [Fibrobacterota bacterium]|nr:MAG: DEAD/DEAH box helicase family protein [Fibrobacterota bacterium]